jgi:hypothetical protein
MQEWKLLASGDFSDSDETSVDDGRPRTHTKPSKSKTRWSATKANNQIKSSLRLEERGAFQGPETPGLHQLARARALEEQDPRGAKLRAITAGMCGLSALTCMETSRAHPGKIHTLCKSLPPLADAS